MSSPGPDLDLSHDQQDDDDEEHEAQPAARPVSPAGAVAPARQGAHQKQDQHDQQNGSECHHALLVVSMPAIAEFVATSVGRGASGRRGQGERVVVGAEAVATASAVLHGRQGSLRASARGPHFQKAPYCMNQPWLTTSDWPVSALLGKLANSSATSATSATVVNSPSTVSLSITFLMMSSSLMPSAFACSGICLSTSGVRTKPGQITFARTL